MDYVSPDVRVKGETEQFSVFSVEAKWSAQTLMSQPLRYSELLERHQQLLSIAKKEQLPVFPKKKFFGNKKASFVFDRAAALQSYYTDLLGVSTEPAIRTAALSMTFGAWSAFSRGRLLSELPHQPTIVSDNDWEVVGKQHLTAPAPWVIHVDKDCDRAARKGPRTRDLRRCARCDAVMELEDAVCSSCGRRDVSEQMVKLSVAEAVDTSNSTMAGVAGGDIGIVMAAAAAAGAAHGSSGRVNTIQEEDYKEVATWNYVAESDGQSVAFSFDDHSPRVFGALRSKWGISGKEFASSLQVPLMDMTSGAGASGAHFLQTTDQRFVAKSVSKYEQALLIKILRGYVQLGDDLALTLLPRFVGLYTVRIAGKWPVRMMMMVNVFKGGFIRDKYDLKGSTHHREGKEGDMVLKDLNFEHSVCLGPRKSAFLDQIAKDVIFLRAYGLMDYSLLLGVQIDNAVDDDVKGPESLECHRPSSGHELVDDADLELTYKAKEIISFPDHFCVDDCREDVTLLHPAEGPMSSARGRVDLRVWAPGAAVVFALVLGRGACDYCEQAYATTECHECGPQLCSVCFDRLHQNKHHEPTPLDLGPPFEVLLHKVDGSTGEFAGQVPYDSSLGVSALIIQAIDGTGDMSVAASCQLLCHRVATQSPEVVPSKEWCGGVKGLSASGADGNATYYLGLIDILQEFNLKKKAEHVYKVTIAGAHNVSAVAATVYAQRFVAYVDRVVTDTGDGVHDHALRSKDDASLANLVSFSRADRFLSSATKELGAFMSTTFADDGSSVDTTNGSAALEENVLLRAHHLSHRHSVALLQSAPGDLFPAVLEAGSERGKRTSARASSLISGPSNVRHVESGVRIRHDLDSIVGEDEPAKPAWARSVQSTDGTEATSVNEASLLSVTTEAPSDASGSPTVAASPAAQQINCGVAADASYVPPPPVLDSALLMSPTLVVLEGRDRPSVGVIDVAVVGGSEEDAGASGTPAHVSIPPPPALLFDADDTHHPLQDDPG